MAETRRELEARLAAAYRAGDARAADELWDLVEGWVKKLAVDFARRTWWDMDESIGAAGLAFLEALGSFDPSRGLLTTYLSTVIPRLLQVARNRDRLIAAPSSYRGPGNPKHALIDALRYTHRLDGLRRGRYGDQHPPSPDPSPPQQLEDAELNGLVGRQLAGLHPTYREVLIARYVNGQTQTEVALDRKVSRQRVWQIERRAMAVLRERLGLSLAAEEGPL